MTTMTTETPAPGSIAATPQTISDQAIADIRAICDGGRAPVIEAIRDALKRRSGKAWSVTGGKGTAYGWLRIDAPPARRTWQNRPLPHNPGGHLPGVENWEEYDSGQPGHTTSPAERAQLADLLGLERVHQQGESIPSSSEHYREYVCRARFGHPGPFAGEQYWD